MTAPRRVYCLELDRVFTSAVEAQLIAGNHKPGTLIARACRSTEAGEFRTAYGRQWCWADSIPARWPKRKTVSRKVGLKTAVVRRTLHDGSIQSWSSIKEAADASDRPSSIISQAIKATSSGKFFQTRGYQFARREDYDRDDFRWPRRGSNLAPGAGEAE